MRRYLMGKDINGKELGKGITQRNDGRYNARVTINGVKINLYDYNLSLLKKNLELKKLKVLREDYSTRPNISLNQWYKDEWFPVYKSPYLKDEVNRHNYIVRYENTLLTLNYIIKMCMQFSNYIISFR